MPKGKRNKIVLIKRIRKDIVDLFRNGENISYIYIEQFIVLKRFILDCCCLVSAPRYPLHVIFWLRSFGERTIKLAGERCCNLNLNNKHEGKKVKACLFS